MRTTIDIPARLRQKLVHAAAEKNLKGFSSIIEEALTGEEYRRAMEILEAGRGRYPR